MQKSFEGVMRSLIRQIIFGILPLYRLLKPFLKPEVSRSKQWSIPELEERKPLRRSWLKSLVRPKGLTISLQSGTSG